MGTKRTDVKLIPPGRPFDVPGIEIGSEGGRLMYIILVTEDRKFCVLRLLDGKFLWDLLPEKVDIEEIIQGLRGDR